MNCLKYLKGNLIIFLKNNEDNYRLQIGHDWWSDLVTLDYGRLDV